MARRWLSLIPWLVGAAIVAGLVLLARAWGKGGDLTLSNDLWTIVGLAAALGAAGGLIYDILEPLRPGKGWKADWFENVTGLPRILRNGSIEWGFLGPMMVGAGAAILLVFLVGVTRTPGAGGAPATTARAFVEPDRLIWMGLLGGFAGPLVLRTLRGRLKDALQKADMTKAFSGHLVTTLKAVEEAEDEVEEAVDGAAPAARGAAQRRAAPQVHALREFRKKVLASAERSLEALDGEPEPDE